MQKQSYPKVKFKKSADKDISVLHAFVKDVEYDNGENLYWAVLKSYPGLCEYFDAKNKYQIINKTALENFIRNKYSRESEKMRNELKKNEKDWEKAAPIFFSLVNGIFPGRKWPNGRYIAYGTIWGMYPRFLNDKTFQIPYHHKKSKYITVVIAHELLHFMFYDYFFKNFPEYKKHKYDFFIWHISEIFNAVIQNSDQWIDEFKIETMIYPIHEKIVKSIKRTFPQKKQDVDMLINRIVGDVKKYIT